MNLNKNDKLLNGYLDLPVSSFFFVPILQLFTSYNYFFLIIHGTFNNKFGHTKIA